MHNFIFEKIKRIQALAEIGLEFSQNIFDRERYEELHEISLQIMNQITDVTIEKIVPVIQEKNGYKTPKVDVRAVVFSDKNEILLIQEKADNRWAMPGGWEIGRASCRARV